jgi:hypothetical protein
MSGRQALAQHHALNRTQHTLAHTHTRTHMDTRTAPHTPPASLHTCARVQSHTACTGLNPHSLAGMQSVLQTCHTHEDAATHLWWAGMVGPRVMPEPSQQGPHSKGTHHTSTVAAALIDTVTAMRADAMDTWVMCRV